jgi:hypothetical protein
MPVVSDQGTPSPAIREDEPMRRHDVRFAVAAREDGLRRVRKLTVRIGAAGVACSAVIAAAFSHPFGASAASQNSTKPGTSGWGITVQPTGQGASQAGASASGTGQKSTTKNGKASRSATPKSSAKSGVSKSSQSAAPQPPAQSPAPAPSPSQVVSGGS